MRLAPKLALYCFLPLALAIAFVPPFLERYEYEMNSDEGLYAMQGALLHRGYKPYAEIWNDQPPLVPQLISWSFSLFDVSLTASRIPILLCSSLLILALFLVVARKRRWGAACLAVASLLASPGFIQFAVAVMVGMPAISLGACSAACAVGYLYSGKFSRAYLALAAFFLGMSMLAKLFTAILIPVIFIAIVGRGGFLKRDVRKARRELVDVALCSLIVIGSVLSYVWFFAPSLIHGEFHQLIYPHLLAQGAEKMGGLNIIRGCLIEELPTVAFVSVGLAFVLLGLFPNKREFWIPLAWLVCASAAVSMHRPIWRHHFLLLSVPLAWLAGLTFSYGYRFCERFAGYKPGSERWCQKLLPVSILYAFGVTWLCSLPIGVMRQYANAALDRSRGTLNQYVLSAMSVTAPDTNWVVTDRPAYALAIDRPVPPELALFAYKRFVAGLLTPPDIGEYISKYNPEQILFSRFPELHDQLLPSIVRDYRAVWSDQSRALYVRRELVPFFDADVNRFLDFVNFVVTKAIEHRRLLRFSGIEPTIPSEES